MFVLPKQRRVTSLWPVPTPTAYLSQTTNRQTRPPTLTPTQTAPYRKTTTTPCHRTTTMTTPRQDGGEGYGQVVGSRRAQTTRCLCCLGPGMFFFIHSYFLLTYIYIFTYLQAYGPTLATIASRWAVFTCIFSILTLAPNASWWGITCY